MSHATPHPAADPAGGPEPAYPHGTHPGLVPGIGVDENRHRFGVDPVVFGVTAVLVLAFVVWGISSPASVGAASSAAFSWAMTTTGWLLNAVAGLSVVAMLVIGLSRFGRIRLGRDDEGPEFSRFSWVAMMFGAGIGVGIFFYGPSEPLSHYL
ncbi:BCCT family transporter, partial [uncultured Micrococcus sp.]